MDLGPRVNQSVTRCRPGRSFALFALFLVAVSGFSPRAEAERTAGLSLPAVHTTGLHGPALSCPDTCPDQVVDPLEEHDLASEPRLGPALQRSEAAAAFNCSPAYLDSQPSASANPARGPPSA